MFPLFVQQWENLNITAAEHQEQKQCFINMYKMYANSLFTVSKVPCVLDEQQNDSN